MANIISLKDKRPIIHKSCWLANNATIIGDVKIARECTIWFSSVIRGDVCSIQIGPKTNIQDGVIIHGTYQKSDTSIGSKVSIGHGAVIHGCTIEDQVLVGMKTVIMDHAWIEPNVIIGAGTVVLEKMRLESGYIYAGVPARKIKPLTSEQKQFHIERTADAYLLYASWYNE